MQQKGVEPLWRNERAQMEEDLKAPEAGPPDKEVMFP